MNQTQELDVLRMLLYLKNPVILGVTRKFQTKIKNSINESSPLPWEISGPGTAWGASTTRYNKNDAASDTESMCIFPYRMQNPSFTSWHSKYVSFASEVLLAYHGISLTMFC